MELQGKTWKFGNDIDTDVIIPARYLNTSSPEELAKHCMEDANPYFAESVQQGDVIVGGKNFGCGSSREHAPISIKAVGVSCVVAKSFARIFYRNAINIGLPILEIGDEVEDIATGDELSVNTQTGEIINLSTNKKYQAKPFPPFMQDLIAAGGLMNYVKEKVKNNA
jgi:3-isopropylmalate/(R)-2-methylmalate dehydratase small subunit